MSEPNKHITPLGEIPDAIDEALHEAEKLEQKLINQAAKHYKEAYNQSKAGNHFDAAKEYVAGNLSLLGSIGTSVGKGHLKGVLQLEAFDMLRIGDSLRNPTGWEIVKDVLRLLNVIPVIGEVRGILKEGLIVTQKPALKNCVFVAINNAGAETEQALRAGKAFFSMERVAEGAELDLAKIARSGTTAAEFAEIRAYLAKTGAAITELRPPLAYLEEGVEVVEEMARANPNGTLVISVRETGKSIGHTMTAQFVRGKGTLFNDNYGNVFEGAAALVRKYGSLGLRDPGQWPTLFFKNTWLVPVFKSSLFNIFFPSVYWGTRLGERTLPKQAFAGPPRGNAVVDRGPLGMG
jgi:hypothetical protein